MLLAMRAQGEPLSNEVVNNMRYTAVSFIAAFVLSLAVPASAHHSHANYAQRDWVELEGTITNVHWMNPHVWIYLEVMGESGKPVVWAMEGGSIAALTEGGWQPDSVQVGDKISARCMPLKDGSSGCLLGYLTTDEHEDKEFD